MWLVSKRLFNDTVTYIASCVCIDIVRVSISTSASKVERWGSKV